MRYRAGAGQAGNPSISSAVLRCCLIPFALGVCVVAAYGADQRLVADGIEVYYGIVPTAVVGQQPGRPRLPAHRGSARRNARHLLVALFDAKSGRRIEDAAVVASVTPLGMAIEEKSLAPMRINDTITFGNFFDFPAGSGPFRIALVVARPQHPALTMTFQYSE